MLAYTQGKMKQNRGGINSNARLELNRTKETGIPKENFGIVWMKGHRQGNTQGPASTLEKQFSSLLVSRFIN